MDQAPQHARKWTFYRATRIPVYLYPCDCLPRFYMLSDLRRCQQDPIPGRTQHPACIAFGLTGIGLGRSIPVDSSKRVAATGFDHGVAVQPRVKSWTQSDMERDGDGERGGRLFDQSSVDHCKNCPRQAVNRQDVCVWIDQHGNLVRFQCRQELIWFHESGCHAFDRMLAFIDGFCQGDRPADCQRLGKLTYDHFESRAMQAERNARRQVAASAQKDECRIMVIHLKRGVEGFAGQCLGLS